MEIGYRTATFQDWPIADTLHAIADAGYDHVELCLENTDLNPADLTSDKVSRIRALMDELGLGLSAVSYHGVRDQLEVRRLRTYAAIERLADLGAAVFIVASRTEEPARLPAQWGEALELYCDLADRCAAQQARLAIEPQPGLVVRSAEDLIKVIRDCGHDNVTGNLDIAHASCTADDLSWAIFQLGSRLVHVHVADVANGKHQHLLPGEGEVDFQEVREILDSVGYDGPVVIDIPRTERDPAKVARQALEAYRQHWGLA